MVVKPAANVPRWLNARPNDGVLRALDFVIDREIEHYVGQLALNQVAEILSKATGHGGSSGVSV
jgi:cation transport protein ChaC